MKEISEVDRLAWKNFIRFRRIATGLLVMMGILTFIGYLLPHYGIFKECLWFSILRAGTQAGLIGGIADWFAVTALFRHPMGIPIPHTAILPTQQKRLGKGLGNFVAHYVFTKEDVTVTLNKIDFPSILTKYLTDSATIESFSKVILNAIPDFLNRFEDGRAGVVISKIFSRLLSGEAVSPLVGKALRTMVNNEHHQEVVSFLLEAIKNSIQRKEQNLRDVVQDRVREQGGRFVGWMFGGSIANKVLTAVSEEIDKFDPQNSELRQEISLWLKNEIEQIETNPERGEKISEVLKRFIDHESVKEWQDDVWYKTRKMIEEDAQKEDGWLKKLIEDSILYFANRVKTDTVLHQKMMGGIQKVVTQSLPYIQEWVVRFTETVVSSWDSQSLITRLECRIGKDLQYVRINGSLVGFLVGAVLYVLLYLCFGNTL